MKKIFCLFAILMAGTAAFAQDSTKEVPQLLTLYYNVKNALVAGDANTAAASALTFVKAINATDYKVISEGNVHTLALDAGRIAETKDIAKQRTYFASLSANMVALAKSIKLSDDPVYQAYCPMKGASWLSNQKEIKNPYYGKAMLSCGEVKATL